MSMNEIRVIGDPVLRVTASEITEITENLALLTQDMLSTLYAAPGIGLAAPQIGVQKRLFVYDWGSGPGVLINPEIRDVDGEWTFEEGCLSIPGLSWELLRPKQIHIVGLDIDGKEVSIEKLLDPNIPGSIGDLVFNKDEIVLSLMQVNDGEETFLIDCLAIGRGSSNASFLFSDRVKKIFHSYFHIVKCD